MLHLQFGGKRTYQSMFFFFKSPPREVTPCRWVSGVPFDECECVVLTDCEGRSLLDHLFKPCQAMKLRFKTQNACFFFHFHSARNCQMLELAFEFEEVDLLSRKMILLSLILTFTKLVSSRSQSLKGSREIFSKNQYKSLG